MGSRSCRRCWSFVDGVFACCGQAFKTCLEVAPYDYQIRKFHDNDAVLLEGLRCSGANHDGCQRACLLFWRMAWLRKVEEGPNLGKVNVTGRERKVFAVRNPDSSICLNQRRIRGPES